jgi:hypothetical protein
MEGLFTSVYAPEKSLYAHTATETSDPDLGVLAAEATVVTVVVIAAPVGTQSEE